MYTTLNLLYVGIAREIRSKAMSGDFRLGSVDSQSFLLVLLVDLQVHPAETETLYCPSNTADDAQNTRGYLSGRQGAYSVDDAKTACVWYTDQDVDGESEMTAAEKEVDEVVKSVAFHQGIVERSQPEQGDGYNEEITAGSSQTFKAVALDKEEEAANPVDSEYSN